MKNKSFLHLGHIFRMLIWLLFCRYKIQVMRYYEYDCGVVDYFAYKKAKSMSKKECIELLKERNVWND